jgi:hypothetical protein
MPGDVVKMAMCIHHKLEGKVCHVANRRQQQCFLPPSVAAAAEGLGSE